MSLKENNNINMPKETKLLLNQKRLELKNKKVTITVNSGEWSAPIDQYLEEESWVYEKKQ